MDVEVGLRAWTARLLSRSSLSEREVDQLLSMQGERCRVTPGREIVKLHDRSKHVSLVLRGAVAQYGQLRSGVRRLIAFRLAGEMIDLPSALLPNACCAQVALVESELFLISCETVRQLVATSPAIATALWRDCCVDAAIVEQTLVVSTGDAAMRIAHLACELGMRNEVKGGSRLRFEVPLTQDQIGEATGITGVHANRTVRLLREAGMLNWKERRVEISDWDRLAKVGEFDPAYLHLAG